MGLVIVGRQFRDSYKGELYKHFGEDRFYMVLDSDRCIRCYKCEIACKVAKEIREGVRILRMILLDFVGESSDWRVANIRLSCLQCEFPECVYACPSGALRKTKQGPVVQNKDLCLGCRICELVCPHAMISFDFELEVARKCDFCIGELVDGFSPACVQTCFLGALVFKTGAELPIFLEQKMKEGAGGIVI
jgi:Fe-S-cluster-containing dehydrogenase component